MAISYEEAIKIQTTVALGIHKHAATEQVSILEASGRILAHDISATADQPPYDSSAMDGFAISSKYAQSASEAHPVRFLIRGTIAAGDAQRSQHTTSNGSILADGIYHSCFEIMTGAQFPQSNELEEFDACVKIEDVGLFRSEGVGEVEMIEITKPVTQYQNRRFAGSDYKKGDVILEAGTTLRSSHVMAMASLGVARIDVRQRLSVAIIATGSELQPYTDSLSNLNQIRNSNGPYLSTLLKSFGVKVYDLGIVGDCPHTLTTRLFEAKMLGTDAIITTGAVSVGKFDHVREVAESNGLNVLYHGVNIRPGHPVLFGTLPFAQVERDCDGSNRGLADTRSLNSQSPSRAAARKMVFFGLPGNPLATVTCARFLVLPLLRAALQLPPELPITAILRFPAKGQNRMANGCQESCSSETPTIGFRTKRANLHVFWHAKRWISPEGKYEVEIIADQGSHKVSRILRANSWVSLPPGIDRVEECTQVQVFGLADARYLDPEYT